MHGRPKKAQKVDVKSSAKNNFLSTLMRLVDCPCVIKVISLFSPFVFAHLSLTSRRVHSGLMGVKDYANRVVAGEYDEVDDDDGGGGGWMFQPSPVEVDEVEVEAGGLDM